jgi:hypothetical protein
MSPETPENEGVCRLTEELTFAIGFPFTVAFSRMAVNFASRRLSAAGGTILNVLGSNSTGETRTRGDFPRLNHLLSQELSSGGTIVPILKLSKEYTC